MMPYGHWTNHGNGICTKHQLLGHYQWKDRTANVQGLIKYTIIGSQLRSLKRASSWKRRSFRARALLTNERRGVLRRQEHDFSTTISPERAE